MQVRVGSETSERRFWTFRRAHLCHCLPATLPLHRQGQSSRTARRSSHPRNTTSARTDTRRGRACALAGREKTHAMTEDGMSMVAPKGACVDSLRYPDIADLMSRLHFSPGDGRIWLDDQRMVLVHTSAMGVLRRELIESLGIDRARGLLTRMGYNSGTRDAELARKVRPKGRIQDMFAVGPQLHMLEGMTAVEPVRLEIDVARGKYYGEFLWKNCAE